MKELINFFLGILKEMVLSIKDPVRRYILLLSIIVIAWITMQWNLDINDKDFKEKSLILIALLLAMNFTFIFVVWVFETRRFIRDVKAEKKEYFERMWNKVSKMSLALGTDPKRVDIANYFVAPHLKQPESDNNDVVDLRTVLKRAWKYNKQSGVVLIGKGGAGKTVLAQWLTGQIVHMSNPRLWDFLLRTIQKTEKPYEQLNWFEKICYWFHKLLVWLELEIDRDYQVYPYAVFIPLLDLPVLEATGKDLIIAYINKAVKSARESSGDANKFFEKRQQSIKEISEHIQTVDDWIEQGLIIPIIDGLDALSLTAQEKFLDGLYEFAQHYPACGPLVLTVRESGLELEKFGRLPVSFWEVQPFDQNQIVQYLGNACKGNTAKAKALWVAITRTAEKDPRLWTMLANPLLLGLLVNNYGNKNLEEDVQWDRIKIYDEYFQELWRRKSKHESKCELPKDVLAAAAYQSLIIGKSSFDISELELPVRTRLINLIVGQREPGQYYFLHASFHAYFAAEFIYSQILTNETVGNLYVEELMFGISGTFFADRNKRGGKEIPNPVHWREVLFLLIERLKQHSIDFYDTGQCHPFIYDVAKNLYSSQTPISKILFLRLLGMLDNINAVDFINQFQLSVGLEETEFAKKSVNWLMTFVEENANRTKVNWSTDLAETGYGLSTATWQELESLARFSREAEKAKQRLALYLFACIHHPRAARFIIDSVNDGMDLPPEVLKELRRMGLLLVAPLLDVYKKAENDITATIQRQIRLIRLMGFATPSKSLAQALDQVIRDKIDDHARNKPIQDEQLAVEAFQALATQGNLNNDILMSYFEKLGKFPERLRPVLIKTLKDVRLGDQEQNRLRELLYSWRKEKAISPTEKVTSRLLLRDSAIQIFQYKLNLTDHEYEEYQEYAKEFVDIINDYPPFRSFMAKPNGIGRRFIGFLWRHRILRGLYSRIRDRFPLKKDFLDSLLDVCDGVNSEQAKRWVELMLKDPGLELQAKAVDVFCKKSTRMGEQYKWFNNVSETLPADVTKKIEQRLFELDAL